MSAQLRNILSTRKLLLWIPGAVLLVYSAMALIIIHSANIPLDMSGGSNTTTSTTSEINSSTNSTPVPSTRGEANSTTIESSKVIATNSTSGPHHALDDDHKKNLGMNSSSTSNSLYVIPYTDTKVERDYIASIQSQYLLANTTSSNSTQTKKKSIIIHVSVWEQS